MGEAMRDARKLGVTHVAFGDLFLEDIRAYREAQLAKAGMTAVFPLWKRPTAELARDMIAAGLRAHLVCVDLKKLPADFAGRCFDDALLDTLPQDCDPCGENGEFHTFVSAGPMFKGEIAVKMGDIVERGGFAYADLLPA